MTGTRLTESKSKNEHPSKRVFGRLLGMVRPHAKLMVQAILFGSINHLSNIFLPVIAAWNVGLFIMNGSIDLAGWRFSLLIVLAIMKALFSYLEQLKNHDIAFRLLKDLRLHLYDSLVPLTPAKTLKKRSGDVLATVGADIDLIEVFFAHTVSPVAIAVIVSTVTTIVISAPVPWFSLIILPFYVMLGIVLPLAWGRVKESQGGKIRSVIASTNAFLTDSLQGLKTILLFNNGKKRLRDIAVKSDELNNAKKKSATSMGFLQAIANILIFSANVLMFVTAGLAFSVGLISPVNLLVVIVTTMSSFGPLFALTTVSHHLTQTRAAASRLFNIIDEKPAVEDKVGCSTNPPKSFDIEFRNVFFTYPGTDSPVLENVNIKIPFGQSLAISGESGTGKSTLLRLLLRFWDVDSGEILMGGTNIKDLSHQTLLDCFSFIEQDTFLFNTTIRENIAIGRQGASNTEIIQAAKDAGLHEFVMGLPLQYESKVGELGDSISSGEKQRIAIARALLKNAPILIMDEPTANLDSLTEARIEETLKHLVGKGTVVIVSHRRTTISAMERELQVYPSGCKEITVQET